MDSCPQNWPTNQELREIGWSQLVWEYQESLNDIIELLRNKNDAFLEEQYEDQDYKGLYNYSFLINGLRYISLGTARYRN